MKMPVLAAPLLSGGGLIAMGVADLIQIKRENRQFRDDMEQIRQAAMALGDLNMQEFLIAVGMAEEATERAKGNLSTPSLPFVFGTGAITTARRDIEVSGRTLSDIKEKMQPLPAAVASVTLSVGKSSAQPPATAAQGGDGGRYLELIGGFVALTAALSGMLLSWRQDNRAERKSRLEFAKLKREIAAIRARPGG